MRDRAFIDTNIFIYLYSEDEVWKQRISQKTVDTYNCVISTQVLNEFSNVCLGKLKLSSKEVGLAIDEIIEQCIVVPVEKHTIKSAIDIHNRYRYSYFDSLMIASAINSDCKYIMTEDLADGQIIDGKLTIINVYSEKNIAQ